MTENQSICILYSSGTGLSGCTKTQAWSFGGCTLITLTSLLLLQTLSPSGLSELESQRQEKVIFTVLLFSLPVSGNINNPVHPDNGSFQVWSITILIKGKEPSAVHKSSGALSSFLKLHFCRQQTI